METEEIIGPVKSDPWRMFKEKLTGVLGKTNLNRSQKADVLLNALRYEDQIGHMLNGFPAIGNLSAMVILFDKILMRARIPATEITQIKKFFGSKEFAEIINQVHK